MKYIFRRKPTKVNPRPFYAHRSRAWQGQLEDRDQILTRTYSGPPSPIRTHRHSLAPASDWSSRRVHVNRMWASDTPRWNMCHRCQAQALSAERSWRTSAGQLSRCWQSSRPFRKRSNTSSPGVRGPGSHVSEQLWSLCLPLRGKRRQMVLRKRSR